jgi:HEAT repeat protein
MKRFYFHYAGRYEWKTADQVVEAASIDIKKEEKRLLKEVPSTKQEFAACLGEDDGLKRWEKAKVVQDYVDRRFAAAALCQLSSNPAAQSATADVAAALADEDAGVRYWAAHALIGLGSVEGSDLSEHHEVVATAMKDKDPGVRCAAAIALAMIAEEETENVIKHMEDIVAALKDSDPQVRIETTRLLVALLEDEELAETATTHVEALRDRRQPIFRASAAEALGLLGGAGLPYVPDLITALQDNYAKVRAAAAKALGCLGVEALKQTCPMLVGLVNSDMDVDVRNAAAEALTMVDLNEALHHADAEFRAWATDRALALGTRELKLHIARFGEMLKDHSGKVRCRVAQALGAVGDSAKDYVQGLLENALEDADAESRVAATKALVKVDPRSLRESGCTGPIAAFLKHDNVAYRKSAAECLGAIGSDAKQEAVLMDEALCDEDASVRLAVARALFNMGKFAVKTCGVNLGKAAKTDKDSDVRKSAAFALYEFNLGVRFGLPPK